MPRVISGQFKGLKLTAPGGRSTRPTADQVKEAVFSMLVSLPFDFQQARVFDFFAGSGSLGIEALSRGAGLAVFADREQESLTAVKRNLAAAKAEEKALMIKVNWPHGLERLTTQEPFNLFLLDPPYNETALPLKILKKAAALNLVASNAVAVWEQAPETLKTWTEAESAPWLLLNARSWGRRAVAFLQYVPDENNNQAIEKIGQTGSL